MNPISQEREPRKLWRAFDRKINKEGCRHLVKEALLKLIPFNTLHSCLEQENLRMDRLSVLGKLCIGIGSCFNDLNAEQKTRIADFLASYSQGVPANTLLSKKISTTSNALQGNKTILFEKSQEIFASNATTAWTTHHKQAIRALFLETNESPVNAASQSLRPKPHPFSCLINAHQRA